MDTFFSSGYLPREEGVTTIVRETIKISHTPRLIKYAPDYNRYHEREDQVILQNIFAFINSFLFKNKGRKVVRCEENIRVSDLIILRNYMAMIVLTGEAGQDEDCRQ